MQQVTWSIECPAGGTKTRASLAAEHNPYVPRYGTRRQMEKPCAAQSKIWPPPLRSNGRERASSRAAGVLTIARLETRTW